MATSTLKCYRTRLTPERNAVIEDIQEFLATKCTLTYEANDFQYQKIDINKVITIAADQEKVGDQTLGNYCDIYQDGRHYYYFIVDADWASQKAVKLTISLDSLNSFSDKIRYDFTEETIVQREHGSRFVNKQPHRNTRIGMKKLTRNIDRFTEDLPISQVLTEKEPIYANDFDYFNWYLIYKTRDDLSPNNTANPVECDLLANTQLLIEKGRSNLPSQRYNNANFMESGKYYYLDPVNNPGADVDSSIGKLGTKDTAIFVFYASGNDIKMRSFTYKNTAGSYTLASESGSAGTTLAWIQFNKSEMLKVSNAEIKNYTDIVQLPNVYPLKTGSKDNVYTIPFSQVDKSNSKLMKIIKLPYCPVNYSVSDDGIYSFPAEWEYKNGMMKLKTNNLSQEFENKLVSDNLDKYMQQECDVSPTRVYEWTYESKLYNSQFFTHKYLYDSFSKEIKLENLDTFNSKYRGLPITVGIRFKPTNTINSKFAFKFNPKESNTGYVEESDYDNFLICSRNNEETIFSNDYINYIRNGYNYDIKNRDLAPWQAAIGVATGLGQAGAAGGIGIKARKGQMDAWYAGMRAQNIQPTAEQYYAASLKTKLGQTSFLSAAAISTGFGAVNTAVNAIFSYDAANRAIEQKKQQLANQSTAVSGSDDVDLLSYYNGNKLQALTYEPIEENKQLLAALFYYTGYSSPHRGVPSFYSRYWFNYVQCTPVFSHHFKSFYGDYLDDIVARFEKGVTIFHHNPEIDIGWDIDQEFENWEGSLLNTSYLPQKKITDLKEIDTFLSVKDNQTKFNIHFKRGDEPDSEYSYIKVKYNGTREVEISKDNYVVDGFVGEEYRMLGWVILPDYDGISDVYYQKCDTYNRKFDSDWKLSNK